MKRKTLTLVICFLALLSVASIGFASWVISKPITAQEQEGALLVETVSTEGYTITVELESDKGELNGKFSFGAFTTPTPTNDWLKSEDSKGEKLTVEVTIKVSDIQNIGDGVPVKFEYIKAGNTHEPSFGNYLSGAQLNVNGSAVENNTLTLAHFGATNEDTGEKSCVLTISFTWGSEFGNTNPYLYFNNKELNDANAKEASDKLTALQEAIAGVSYKLTVGPTNN